jgi:hypothetical protein
MWLIVFARGRCPLAAAPAAPPTLPFAIEFFLTRLDPDTELPLTLSRRPVLGREEVVLVICSFCWWRRRRSLRAKHRVHSGHSNGFSFVCDLSCLFRCSRRANDLPQVPQTCGLGLSVFGGGNCFVAPFCVLFESDLVSFFSTCFTSEDLVSESAFVTFSDCMLL